MTVQDDMAFLQTRDGVGTLNLNRVHQANALSADFVEEITACAEAAFADPDIHTLVLRAGGRHFCSGFDLGDLDSQSDGDLLLRFVRIEQLLNLLWHAPIPTLAIVAGRAWGAGADLAASCDMRIALPDASFAFPGAAFGLVLGTRRLAERVGRERAGEITRHGKVLDAREALACGLASHACEPQALEGTLSQLAARPAARREAVAALRAAAHPGAQQLGDGDLAALVRSAGPGLAQRIADYRAAVRMRAGKAR